MSTASARTLEGEHLTLGYGRSTVVHGVSVTLEPGTVTALVGPNGSGKSTLLRSLARLHPVNEGVVRLDGDDISLLNPATSPPDSPSSPSPGPPPTD
ncbi:ABC transporter ATP-binding protein [Corynebacterium sp. CNJ-954]|uniref:ATP-binding cassette domain-containing protein n=1 Tax=Corynebacterium sp. CNJ-954 TaxID=1904962 RepID=UPI001C9E9ADB